MDYLALTVREATSYDRFKNERGKLNLFFEGSKDQRQDGLSTYLKIMDSRIFGIVKAD